MKLHLVLLVSLFNLSSGFMAELRGPLAAEECTGDEYALFKHCATLGAEADPNLSVLAEIEEIALVNRGDERKLSCSGCTGGAAIETFCYTWCASGRRLLEGGMDTPNLRRELQDNVCIFESGAYIGSGDARDIAEAVIACLGDASTNHPCLGTTNTMTLIVTV
jgi:hypothetical protein